VGVAACGLLLARHVKRFVFLGLLAFACSAPPPTQSTNFSAAQAVVPSNGQVIASPNVVTVTFVGDDEVATIESWAEWVVGSTWLTTVGAEYGVGAGQASATLHLTSAAPGSVSFDDMVALVVGNLSNGTFPAPSAGTIYMVYFPETTTLYQGSEVSCVGFSGYHGYLAYGPNNVAFAAIGRCPTYWAGLDTPQNVQRTASHELIEAATNPYGQGYVIEPSQDRTMPEAWLAAVGEGEIGDLCSGSQVDEDSGFILQRIWSNGAAAAGTDPCTPASSASYFTVEVAASWFPIAPGESITIPLVGHAAGPVPDWLVRSHIKTNTYGFGLKTASDTTAVADGSTYATTNDGRALSLTVTAPATPSSGDSAGIEIQSATPTAVANPDTTREADYHYLAIGVYVP
jgi:hypothetical protein